MALPISEGPREPRTPWAFSPRTFLSPLFCLVLILGAQAPLPVQGQVLAGQTVETAEYLLFIPPELDMRTRRPLLLAFSPSADAPGMIGIWEAAVRRHGCLILASKLVRNGMDVPPILRRLARLLPRLSERYPIDLGRVVATGVSGGGMTAHLMAFFHPELVAAVISNIGYVHENSLKKRDRYPRQKVVAFLTGPTDYNYALMKEDRKFLAGLGWRTRWLEFPGGHVVAPPDKLEEALSWVLEQLRDPPAR